MPTAKVERLVNLTVALLEARRPLTLAELKQLTREYTQRDEESARRQFERDKDDLRRLGVPIEAVTVDLGAETGYVIDRAAYELPDVRLTPEEVAALALAVRLTGGHEQRLALAKLAARAPDPAPLDPDAAAPLIDPGPTAIDPTLAESLVRRTPVTFRYRNAAGEVAERHVDPYAVVQRRGAWYLVGHDHLRDGQRVFRLDRVDGPLRTAGEPGAFTLPAQLDLVAAVSGPEVEEVPARLAVARSARYEVELRGGRVVGETDDGRDLVEVAALDPYRDRTWLLGLAGDVEVLEPVSLREELLAAHRATLEVHR